MLSLDFSLTFDFETSSKTARMTQEEPFKSILLLDHKPKNPLNYYSYWCWQAENIVLEKPIQCLFRYGCLNGQTLDHAKQRLLDKESVCNVTVYSL